jgi:hypothetical protein
MNTITLNQTTRQIFVLLKFTFAIVPVVAGLDKFTDLLADWEMYLNPGIARLLPFSPHVFMKIVGVIEITAGLIVFVKPGLGAWIVSAWLISIALTLITGGTYLDVAVRDVVMAIAAYCLARLAGVIDKATV